MAKQIDPDKATREQLIGMVKRQRAQLHENERVRQNEQAEYTRRWVQMDRLKKSIKNLIKECN